MLIRGHRYGIAKGEEWATEVIENDAASSADVEVNFRRVPRAGGLRGVALYDESAILIVTPPGGKKNVPVSLRCVGSQCSRGRRHVGSGTWGGSAGQRCQKSGQRWRIRIRRGARSRRRSVRCRPLLWEGQELMASLQQFFVHSKNK